VRSGSKRTLSISLSVGLPFCHIILCDVLGDAIVRDDGFAIAALLMGSWLAVDIAIYSRRHLVNPYMELLNVNGAT